jgi:hypothetical protein
MQFKSVRHDISTHEQLYGVIKAAALDGACLLKGELDRELVWESRAGHTDANKPTSWVVFDLDYLPSITTIDDFLGKIAATDASYVLQWSASYGLHGDYALRAHLFFLLDQPHAPPTIKLWLKQLNLQAFTGDLTLSKTRMALRWGLDITTCQSDKLIFVAPPICHPPSINHFTGERIVLVRKSKDLLTLPTAANLLSIDQIRALEEAKINELRRAAGLEPRSAKAFAMKEFKGETYLPKPDEATVTGVKTERDFVYLNLNGGDSFAYYHPKDNPTLIYNFKGEPTYKTQELIPDYWYALRREANQIKERANTGKQFLAFRDFRTATYYNGWYDEDTDEVTLHAARSERQLVDFLATHGQPVPEAVPIWSVIYDPHAKPLDLHNRVVNTFRPSRYMRDALTKETHAPFPTIDRLTRHVVGEECLRHWYNWLAYLYQRRSAPGTAWVQHGVPGIGKGVLFNKVLSPLFGESNVTMKRMEELEDKFNEHLENCLLCFIDEAQVSDSGRSKMIMANIKNQITEPRISIRRMRQSPYEVTNHVGWIFASNMPDAVVVAPNDRRFNVGSYQASPIKLTDEDFANLNHELLDFAVFLRLYEVDELAVRTPLINDARAQLILVSRPSADIVAQAILDGSLHQLWEALPITEPQVSDHREQDAYYNFRKLMHQLVKEGPLRTKLAREELHTIFNFCVGNVSPNPWKFTTYLKHHGIEVKRIWFNDMTVAGINVAWKDPPEWFHERLREIYQLEHPQLKVIK